MHGSRALERLLDRRHVAEDGLEESARLRDERRLGLVVGERLDVARRLHERVVGDARHRAVPAPAADPEQERRGHLLSRGAAVERRLAEHEAVASALVDREVAARRVGVRLREPAEATSPRRPPRRPRTRKTRSPAGEKPSRCERCEGDSGRGDLSLHVERASPPDLVVHEIARPRVSLPLRRVGEHRVRVREERERRPVAAAKTRDDVRPLRLARVELDLDPVPREVVAEHLGGADLVPRRVDRLSADQRLQQRRDLLARRPVVPDRRPQRSPWTAPSARCGPPRAPG